MMQKEIEEFGPFELLLTGEHTTKQWEIYQRKINLIQDAACAPMSARYDENTLNALQATYSLKNKEFNLEDGITLEALEILKERKANHKFEKAGQIAGRYHIGEDLLLLAEAGIIADLADYKTRPDANTSNCEKAKKTKTEITKETSKNSTQTENNKFKNDGTKIYENRVTKDSIVENNYINKNSVKKTSDNLIENLKLENDHNYYQKMKYLTMEDCSNRIK